MPIIEAQCAGLGSAQNKVGILKTIFVLNGPNLNALGKREPGIYGGKTLAAIAEDCKAAGAALGLEIDFRQSNHEGDLVDWIQEASEKAAGIVINPGAYSHTSIAIHDAIRAAAPLPVAEVHLSNIHAREPFRHRSFVSRAARGVICGLGIEGYGLAIDGLVSLLATDSRSDKR
jgi:3-dehydroquinate dehydratase-2